MPGRLKIKDKKPGDVLLATRNRGKVREIRRLLKGLGIRVQSLHDLSGAPAVKEDGSSFTENALKKARFYAGLSGMLTVSDDSGVEVEALKGQPGVYSARYAGEGAGDEANIRKLLKAMEGLRNRRAAFECVIAIAVPRGPALTYEGRCEGEISSEQIGRNGFGYDPVFFYQPLGKTFAELSQEEKNQVSHRGKASAKLLAEFDKVIIWLEQRLKEEPF